MTHKEFEEHFHKKQWGSHTKTIQPRVYFKE